MVQIFFSLVLVPVEMNKRKVKKLTGKNLNVDRKFFKDVIGIFDVTLFNQIAGVGPIPIPRNNCKPFALFPCVNTPPLPPLSNDQIKIFMYIPTTTFYYNRPSCPPNSLLIHHIFSWKSKLKLTGVDITCFFWGFFQDAKPLLTKHESLFWKRLMKTFY